MIRYLRFGLVLAAVAVLATGAVACKNSKKTAPSSTATRAVATAAKSPPDATKAPQATRTPGAGAFDSYHYTVELTFTVNDPEQGETSPIKGTVEGDYVAPDSHSFSNSFALGGLSSTERVVIIGDQAWYKEGDTDWRATTRDDVDVQNAISLTSADPNFLDDPEFEQNLSSLDSEPDSINGVEARRYYIPKEAIDQLRQLLGEDFLQNTAGLSDFEMTVWVEEQTGKLVRAELSATGSPEVFQSDSSLGIAPDARVTIEMTINLTGINDGSISVDPPS